MLLFSNFSVNKGLIQHVVQSWYNYNLTFRKLEIHTVKMRPVPACYTSGRGAPHFLGFGRCTSNAESTCRSYVSHMASFPEPVEYKIVRNVQSVRTYVTELDQSNTPNVCTDTCKFKTKRSGKQHDMIQCSVCAQWYHTDCVGLKKGRPSWCSAMHLMSTHPGANKEHCRINIDPHCSHEQYIEHKQQSD